METSFTSPPLRIRPQRADYKLIGGAGERAAAAGLASAEWYKCPVPRAELKALMKRGDAQAIRDTAIWYAAILAAGLLAWYSLGTAWAIPAFLLYGTLYCGPADSRWHEAGHGTAFKTRWMSDLLYQVASFQVMRRPTVWRWSHTRHHTDTLVTGRDPEIAAPVPVDIASTLMNFFAIKSGPRELWRVLQNAAGRFSDEEKCFVPESEWPKVTREARAWVAIYAVVIGSSIALQSWLPLLYIGLPSFYGAWLFNFFGLTQHAGLPENVLDHRLNCRTVKMNPLFRFLYWNMNYHVEHHMYPMVPFHALPQLHEAMKADCPPAYPSTIAAYREIIPAMLRQAKDPHHHVVRVLPAKAA